MVLGIDIGGTSIKIGLVINNQITKKYSIKTNPETLIEDLVKSFKTEGINIEQMHAVGVAIPGFIDHKKGIISLSGNLGYKDYDFKTAFEEKIKRPVFLVNDANAAALGEYWVGAGKKYDSTILYTLGTGVGGGIVINNELVFGANGYAGELGHGGFFQDEVECTCGLKNCIEPISSATGLTRILREELNDDSVEIIDIMNDFINKDPKIIKSFRKSLTPLAMHIATLETSLNPEAIIIGGGPSNIGKPLADFIYELVGEYQLDFIHKSTPILIAETKNDAGILGAAYWAITNESKKRN